MDDSKLRLHLVQITSHSHHPLRSLENLQNKLASATILPGDWIVLPEMWPGAFFPQESLRQQTENAFCYHALKRFCREHHCFIAGSMLEWKDAQAYNSAFVLNPQGELLAHYRKIHLFPLSAEIEKYQPGKKIQVFETSWGKLGMAICFDLRFPELFRKMAEQEAHLILIPSAWPQNRLDHLQTLLKARAIENQCFVVCVNKCGKDEAGLSLAGHSAVFGPWGEKIGALKQSSAILSVELNRDTVDEVRKRYPFLRSKVLT